MECSEVCFETTSCLRVPSFLDSFSIVRDFIWFGNYVRKIMTQCFYVVRERSALFNGVVGC